jgi:hypothetical protein
VEKIEIKTTVKGRRTGAAKLRLRGRFSTVTRNGRSVVMDTNRLLHSPVAKQQLERLKQPEEATTT